MLDYNFIKTTFLLLTPFQQSLLKTFQKLHKKYGESLFPAIETLSKWIGCCRRTIFRALKKLAEVGFVTSMNRGYGRTSLYFLSDDIANFDFIEAFKPASKKNLSEDVTSMSPNVFTNRNTKDICTFKSTENSDEKLTAEGYKAWLPKELHLPLLKDLSSDFRGFVTRLSSQVIERTKEDFLWYFKQKQGKIGNKKHCFMKMLKINKDKFMSRC